MSATTETIHTCRICNTVNQGNLYHVKEMMYGFRDEFLYFQCTHCECLQITEFPKNISKYYPSGYYSFKQYDGKKFKGVSGKLKILQYQSALTSETSLQKATRMVFPTKRFKEFKDIKITKDSRILDVGCGNGDKFLYPLAEMGYKNLLGCDPYLKSDIHYSNGLQIKNTDVFSVEGTWDIIIYHHAFEHVPNPLENLQQIKKLLSEQGICIISVPTASSYAWRHFKTNWYQLDAPRHFFLHSLKSMNLLAQKTDLTLSRTIFNSDYKQFTVSQDYEKDISMITPHRKNLFSYLKRKWKKQKYSTLARKLNRSEEGDIATFYLKH